MIPVLLMYLCRLSILWKAEILFLGGHLPMKEKANYPKSNEIRNKKCPEASVSLNSKPCRLPAIVTIRSSSASAGVACRKSLFQFYTSIANMIKKRNSGAMVGYAI